MPSTRKTAPTNRIANKPARPAPGDAEGRRLSRLVRKALTFLEPVARFLDAVEEDFAERRIRDPINSRRIVRAARATLAAARGRLRALRISGRLDDARWESSYAADLLRSLAELGWVLGEEGSMDSAFVESFTREALACVEQMAGGDEE